MKQKEENEYIFIQNPQTKIEENENLKKKTTKNRELMATDRANIYYRDFNHKHIMLKESRHNFHKQNNRRMKSNLALTTNRKKNRRKKIRKRYNLHTSLLCKCSAKKFSFN